MPQLLAQPTNCPSLMVLKAALSHRKVQPCCHSALLLISTFSAGSWERLVTGCFWVASQEKEHVPETAGGLCLVCPGGLLMKVRHAWKGIQWDLPGATCTSWTRALGRLGPALCTLTFLSLESFSQESFCPVKGTDLVGLEMFSKREPQNHR